MRYYDFGRQMLQQKSGAVECVVGRDIKTVHYYDDLYNNLIIHEA